jgi:hypothetical protein
LAWNPTLPFPRIKKPGKARNYACFFRQPVAIATAAGSTNTGQAYTRFGIKRQSGISAAVKRSDIEKSGALERLYLRETTITFIGMKSGAHWLPEGPPETPPPAIPKAMVAGASRPHGPTPPECG